MRAGVSSIGLQLDIDLQNAGATSTRLTVGSPVLRGGIHRQTHVKASGDDQSGSSSVTTSNTDGVTVACLGDAAAAAVGFGSLIDARRAHVTADGVKCTTDITTSHEHVAALSWRLANRSNEKVYVPSGAAVTTTTSLCLSLAGGRRSLRETEFQAAIPGGRWASLLHLQTATVVLRKQHAASRLWGLLTSMIGGQSATGMRDLSEVTHSCESDVYWQHPTDPSQRRRVHPTSGSALNVASTEKVSLSLGRHDAAVVLTYTTTTLALCTPATALMMSGNDSDCPGVTVSVWTTSRYVITYMGPSDAEVCVTRYADMVEGIADVALLSAQVHAAGSRSASGDTGSTTGAGGAAGTAVERRRPRISPPQAGLFHSTTTCRVPL
jgi:hypothetical protein